MVASITALDCSEDEEPMWYAYEEDQVTFSNYSQLEFTLQSHVGILIQTLDNEYHSDVQWQILLNKNKVIDSTYLQYDSDAGVTHRGTKSGEESIGDIVLAQASANGKKYYVAFPMPTAMIRNTSADFIPYLKKGSGCRSVLYAADGTNPRYNNEIPFEIGLKDGNGKDLAIDDYEFTWFTESEYITLRTEDLEKNQCSIYPSEIYDGRSVTIALECFVTYGDIEIDVHIPIYFYLNTYGYNELNDWNGNSLEINEDGGYILTPQVGAGIKNSDNTFTGLLMGKVKLNSDSNEKIGLIGLYNGVQTLFLDSQTGRSEFGKVGAGQIILDPSTNEAIIQSGNYKAGESGMQINLTAPTIAFGNGNFSVNSSGVLTANEVDITGKITATSGYIGNGVNGFVINPTYFTNGGITSVTSTTKAGVYVGIDGINVSGGTAATTSYITKNNVNIGGKLTWNGSTLSVIGNITTELLTATGGTIGCWKINSLRMYDNSNSSGYTGVNKYGSGQAFWAGGTDLAGTNAPFRVSHSGRLDVEDIHIKHTLYFYDPNSKKDLSVVSANDIASQYWSREVCIGLVGTGTEIRFTKSVEDAYQYLPGSIIIGSPRQTYVQIACADIELQASGYTQTAGTEVIGTILLNGNITTSKIWNGKNC